MKHHGCLFPAPWAQYSFIIILLLVKKLITIFSDELVREKQEIVEENRRKEMIQDQKLVSHHLVFMKIFQTICTC